MLGCAGLRAAREPAGRNGEQSSHGAESAVLSALFWRPAQEPGRGWGSPRGSPAASSPPLQLQIQRVKQALLFSSRLCFISWGWDGAGPPLGPSLCGPSGCRQRAFGEGGKKKGKRKKRKKKQPKFQRSQRIPCAGLLTARCSRGPEEIAGIFGRIRAAGAGRRVEESQRGRLCDLGWKRGVLGPSSRHRCAAGRKKVDGERSGAGLGWEPGSPKAPRGLRGAAGAANSRSLPQKGRQQPRVPKPCVHH